MDQGEKVHRKQFPKEKANICSVLSFFYTLKILIKGFRTELEEEDIYDVYKKLKSKKIGNRLEENWIKDSRRKGKASLIRVMWACYGRIFIFYGIFEMCLKTAIGLIIPHATGKMVKYFGNKDGGMTINDAYLYTAILLITKLVDIILFHNYLLLLLELGTLGRTAFCSLIYRKCLKLSPAALSEYNTGKIVTLMTKDVQVIDSFVMHGNDIWISLVVSFVMTLILYLRLGYASLLGVGFFLLVIPLETYVGRKAGQMRIESCRRTDARLQVTQEALSAIKIIKMYTWEKFFIDKISTARKQEVKKLRTINCLKALSFCIGYLASHISFYILLIAYVKYGTNVSAENIFFAIGVYEHIRFNLAIAVPFSVLHIAEMAASINRIGKILHAEEIPPATFVTDPGIKPKILLSNVTFKIKDKVIIDNVSCTISSGLNIITGPLGSGKSSLLKVILQDYPPTRGHLLVQGNVSYACQDPWLFPASIKHNILFGEELNEERYQKVIRVCALKYDLDILVKGDETIVEDRGMNLSKGQQARINLARAIYKDSDIYLLDDCLAALDQTVQDHIFKECIKEFLKGKICLWVSHSVKSIREADQVIIMEHGTIKSITKPVDISENEIKQIIDNDQEKKRKSLIECDIDEKDEVLADESDELLASEIKIKGNLYRENKKIGSVDLNVIKKYFSFGGGLFVLIGIICLYTGDQFSVSYLDKIMTNWVNCKSNITILTLQNKTNTTEYFDVVEKGQSYLNLYSIMLVTASFAILFRSWIFFIFASRISVNIHKTMIANVINASMEFFDNTFIGNILNRFSRDLSIIDENMPYSLSECIRTTCSAMGVFGLIATVNPWYLIPSGLICIMLVIMRSLYMPTGRSLKRLDCATRSPVVGHLNATLEGLTTIRAYKREDIVRDEFDRHQDLYTSAYHLSFTTARAFAVALNLISVIYICGIVLHLLFFSDYQAGDVGLILTQCTHFSNIIEWVTLIYAYLEKDMTSVERVLEYSEHQLEDQTTKEIKNWPKQGSVKFSNVSLTYAKTNETVLKYVSFTIQPREKIGIVGRTGAGKSSVISALFRIYDTEGKIFIDNVDITGVSVGFLRANISTIPQDPVLFDGTIRENIDPYCLYTDEQIWQALGRVHLKHEIKTLSSDISESGIKFSAGKKQLFNLARALIRNNKIVVLDEATANMDTETDLIINEIIKKEFKCCTVLTIAHKLESIMNSDKIAVFERGSIAEFDSLEVLIKDENSLFSQMLEGELLSKRLLLS